MTDELSSLIQGRKPAEGRPLHGLTVLLVEDSRFASEAMRLLCLRSGARIRRADSLRAAARHLATYRPSVVIVDMGLPDGSGAQLIRELAQAQPRNTAVLGISGRDEAEAEAMAAGADGFLSKPVESLAGFQAAVLAALPEGTAGAAPRAVIDDLVVPDPIALRDDLAHAAHLLDWHRRMATGEAAAGEAAAMQGQGLDYLATFLSGVARICHDLPLAEAAARLLEDSARGRTGEMQLRHLDHIVRDRLAAGAAL